MITAYYEYKAAGLSTLPTKSDKSPLSGTWTNGITDENLYKQAHGIGIICGKISGNVECIDFDNHFGDAKQIITDFMENDEVKSIYEKYSLPIESTVSGGFHLLYRCDYIEGNKKLAQRPKLNANEKWVPDTIIETRGEGGYFVAAPTKGYKVVKNDLRLIKTITKEERAILISHCRAFNQWNDNRPTDFEGQDRPGDKYNRSYESKSDMEHELLMAGWSEKNKGQWVRPGKKDGISATVGKVAENILYVFSSNAYPFEPNKAYTPFQAITLLKYNGDFKEFAKVLAEKYDLKPQQQTQVKKQKTEIEYSDILWKTLIDTSKIQEKPPVAAYIADQTAFGITRKRLFTLSNFSCITGKAKSRKTTFLSMVTASMLSYDGLYNKFYGNLPENKRLVLYFDTEQGDYDAYRNIQRIEKMNPNNSQMLGGYALREYSPIERCEIIEQALIRMPQVGFVVIDGVADLANAINDEEESTRVIGLLLRWTKQYNIHIATVLHQNKNDNFATGWLGSSVMKKAEMVISVSKEKGSESESTVSCEFSRGIDFLDFSFNINDDFMPELQTKIHSREYDKFID